MEIPVFNAISVDPDQTPRSVASVLGLQCLPMSLLWNARLKLVIAIQKGYSSEGEQTLLKEFSPMKVYLFPLTLSSPEFLKWTLPSMKLNVPIISIRDVPKTK